MLSHIHEMQHTMNERMIAMEAELQRLATEVGDMNSAVLGADALLDRLSAMVAAIPTSDPATQAKITELADALAATKADLAAAVVRNTPADVPAP